MEVVSQDIDTVEECSEELESLGIDIEQSDLLRRENSQPFNHLAKEMVGESKDE